MNLDVEFAKYLVDVAKAIESVTPRTIYAGTTYITEIRFGYEDADLGFKLVASADEESFEIVEVNDGRS